MLQFQLRECSESGPRAATSRATRGGTTSRTSRAATASRTSREALKPRRRIKKPRSKHHHKTLQRAHRKRKSRSQKNARQKNLDVDENGAIDSKWQMSRKPTLDGSLLQKWKAMEE